MARPSRPLVNTPSCSASTVSVSACDCSARRRSASFSAVMSVHRPTEPTCWPLASVSGVALLTQWWRVPSAATSVSS